MLTLYILTGLAFAALVGNGHCVSRGVHRLAGRARADGVARMEG